MVSNCTDKEGRCLRWVSLGSGSCPLRPPRGVVKYLQPRVRLPRSVPRRGLRSRLQNLPRAWQRVRLPTPHRGVPGRAGGGRGAQLPAVGVHGSVRGQPAAGGMRAGTRSESRASIPKSRGSGFNS